MSTLEHFFKSTSDAESSSSVAVPAFAFLAAQRKTEKVASTGKKRGSYATTSEELKAKVVKYTAENGASASLRHLKSAQELDLKESTVRGWVTTYQKRLDSLRKEGKPLTVSVLSEKSRGKPLLVGNELEEQLKPFVGQLRSFWAVVNSAIVRAAARGIIMAKDANLLEENEGASTSRKNHGHSKMVLSATCIPVAKQCISLRCCPYLLTYVISAHAACKTERCRHFV